MIYFELGNFNKTDGNKIKELMQGISYMSFNVIIAPIGSECCVTVEGKADTVEKLKNHFMFCLACEVVKC